MALGNKLKIILDERGMTVKDFANKIGIPPTTLYSFIKRDSSTGKLELIAKICKGLDIDISDFLNDDYFDIATVEEPGAEENERKFLEEKFNEILEVLKSPNISNQKKEQVLNDYITQAEIIENMHIENAQRAYNTYIDLSNVSSHPINILQQKLENNEPLTEDEQLQFNAHMKKAIGSLSNTLIKLETTLKSYYQLLNDDGQQKADEQIKRALEQIEMLTKIPDYQLEHTMQRIVKSVQDGHLIIGSKNSPEN